MKSNGGSTHFWIGAIKLSVLAMPALTILALIIKFGVDVPFWDQWDEVPVLIRHMNNGTVGFSDFIAQHNEHRILFPRLLMFCLALLTHWNIKAELLTSWILACICAYNLWRLSRITGWAHSKASFWLLLAANILLFTPLQHENWLWGFQIGFFVPLVAITSMLWIVPSSSTSISFLAAITLSIVANFSIASGFISWLLALPLLLFPNGQFTWRGRQRWWAAFILWFVGTQVFHFWGYQKPFDSPSMVGALLHPLEAAEYVFAYLGSAFAWGTPIKPLIVAGTAGLILAILFAGCAIYLLMRRRDRTLIARALPWLTLCLFALASDTVTAIGRAGFGPGQALSSRYVTFSVMMPVGLIFLIPLVLIHWRAANISPKNTVVIPAALGVLTTILVVLLYLSSIASLKEWQDTRDRRLRAKALVQLINAVTDPDNFSKYVYPSSTIAEDIKLLGQLGYFRPEPVKTKFIRDIVPSTLVSDFSFGYFDRLTQSVDGQAIASGWSILGDKRGAAAAILLTYDDDGGQPIIFATGFSDTKRPDIVNTFKTPAHPDSGWHATFSTRQLPTGLRAIRAWAFDPESCRAYPINGTKVLDVRL